MKLTDKMQSYFVSMEKMFEDSSVGSIGGFICNMLAAQGKNLKEKGRPK